MRKIGIMVAVAALTAVPALAMQEQEQDRAEARQPPPTMPGYLRLYQFKDYNGEDYPVDGAKPRTQTDWNVGSLSIHPGDRWQLCARPRFRDPCIILDRSVHDATLIGVEGQIGSIRPAPEEGDE